LPVALAILGLLADVPLSLQEELKERPVLGPNASESEKDALIRRLTKENASLKITVEGHEANLRAPFRKVYEDVVKEWEPKVEHWQKKEAQARMYGDELKKTLDRETVVSIGDCLWGFAPAVAH
jgi:hypothetical protein